MLFQYLSYLHSLLSCGSEFPLHGCIIMVLYETTEQYATIKQNKIGLPVLTWKDKCQAVLSKQGKLQISIHIMSLYFVKKKKKRRIKINTIKWISMLTCTENSWKKYTQLQKICKAWVSEWVSEVAQLCPTLCYPVDCTPRLLCPWDSPGKNTGVGCHFLLQV